MTFWKGMFRLWILTTVLWAVLVGLLGWTTVARPNLPRRSYYLRDAQSVPYLLAEAYPSYDWVRNQRELYLPNSITLFAARDIPDAAVTAAQETVTRQASDSRNGEAWVARFKTLGWMLLALVAVSGVVLILGFAVRWVVQGFGFQPKVKPSR